MKQSANMLPPSQALKCLFLFMVLSGFLALPLLAQFDDGGRKATPLGENVNTAYDELTPRLSPDDQRLYFVRSQHPENIGGRVSQDIWYSDRRADGSWTSAKNIGAPLNNNRHNSIGAVGFSGTELLLANTYGNAPTPGISFSEYKNGRWEMPETIIGVDTVKPFANYLTFCADMELSALILSMADASGQEDLFVSFRTSSGEWTPPITLGPDVNTARFETTPFLARDSKTLFFASNGHGGEGDADIFVTRRLDETWQRWSKPVNLGPNVNTPGFDAHFIVDSRGETAYFASGATPEALSDIYTLATADIPALTAVVANSMVPDTLEIVVNNTRPVPLSLDEFGISDRQAPFASAKSLNGQGKVTIRSSDPVYTYRSAPGATETELVEITMCDPPHSDDCKVVILKAYMRPTTVVPAPPRYITLRTRTPKNTPVKLDLGANPAAVVDARRTNAERPANRGSIALNNETGGEHVFFRPAPEFVGVDTIDLYLHCDKARPEDCILAKVIVDVYTEVIAVVEPEPVDTVAVTPIDPADVGDVLVTGKITDSETGKPLAVNLTFFAQPANQQMGSIESDPQTGRYELRLPAGTQYSILAKDRYHFDESSLVAASARDKVVRDIALTPLPTEVGTVYRLDNIYFDTDKATLRPESRVELTRLYDFLKSNPTVRIQVNGHTDSKSPDDYNLKLSENRARAVVNYLKYQGVMGTRLDSRGYGETEPVSTNDTEAGRALNRRVEFVITKK